MKKLSEYVAEIKGVTKRFPGVVAMRDMHLQIRHGEVHGLIGENGAGKSTLIKYLTGVHKADQGEMWVDGEKVEFNNPNDARKAGIACVYQELNIVKLLSITDNIFMGHCLKKKSGLLDYREMHKQAHEAMQSLGQDIDPRTECGKLGMGVQQMVEIGKAVQLSAKLIIMDEPTSSLGEKEVKQLMETIRRLKSNGVAVLFVSHKLEELFEICDRVTVIRDGEYIMTENIENLNNDKLINAMVGRTLENLFPKEFGVKGAVALSVRGLNSLGVLHNVCFDAYKGQVLGFAGLVGAGRTETFRAIFGADPNDGGEIIINGKKVTIRNPKDAIRYGIGLLTEDRKGQGLILPMPIRYNLILSSFKRFSKGPFLNQREVEKCGNANVQSLRIKTPHIDVPAVQLSGGNQQKVVIGKWMNTDIEIFIFDEPTRGIDVGAKIEVYKVMNEFVKQGKCVIMISSELPEILGMSDRVIVMRKGRVMADIERDSEHFNQQDIIKAAWGGKLA
jgi:ribose transport system ATP-binding protein